MEKQMLARVLVLPKMSVPELKELWQELFKDDALKIHKAQMVKKLAYRLQELSYGVSSDIEARIARSCQGLF